ncbi:arsenate reductase (glutaredoxin) [Rhodobacterales bacterium 52_120_T64]|nr:arsenate reductase (glutaredoxin) [Rhodobacterales bacterium 52_120_T64]
MTQPIIWHNPRCSKSRETLAILEDKGFSPVVVMYLEVAPSQGEIRNTLALLKIDASQLIRSGESLYKELELANASEADLVNAMAEHPILIERPVVFHNGKASLGRPPSSVLRIL